MRYRILYVEDNRIDFEMVKAVLEDQGLLEVIYRVESREEFLFTLEEQKIDIILTDFSLPAFHGLEVVKLVNETFPGIPVIMITGNLSDEIAVDIIKKGAWDYVLKENIYRLVPAIESCMDRLKMKQDKDQVLQTLKQSENNYRALAESSPYGILVHVNGRVFYHNRKAVKIITGEDKGSFLSLKLVDYIHPNYKDQLVDRMNRIYRGEKVEGYHELKFLNQEGKELILEVASSPIFFKGYPAGQVMFRDIAERKKAEMELIQAKQRAEESDRLKTAFLENMSHEIRTPLNGIMGFATLLKERNLTEPDKLSYIKIIEDSGKHLLSIIDDLIEVSKIETGQFDLRNEVFNLNGLLDEIYVFFKQSEKYAASPVELVVIKPVNDQKAAIYSDKSRLRQLFYNLLNNAFKFTDKGR
ncbi:MAG: histidine kinase dimerization/phospho-acceptor domain-containing protein, partial [Bacteroidales bacterium]